MWPSPLYVVTSTPALAPLILPHQIILMVTENLRGNFTISLYFPRNNATCNLNCVNILQNSFFCGVNNGWDLTMIMLSLPIMACQQSACRSGTGTNARCLLAVGEAACSQVLVFYSCGYLQCAPFNTPPHTSQILVPTLGYHHNHHISLCTLCLSCALIKSVCCKVSCIKRNFDKLQLIIGGCSAERINITS